MKIVSIFAHQLYAIKYSDQEKDEYNRLFDDWTDAEYLETFFEENEADIANGYYGSYSVESAIFETYDFADQLQEQLRQLNYENSKNQQKGLDKIFKPLSNPESSVTTLSKNKARRSWLRLYALKLDNNVYIITGGAIKLTRKMQEREHTNIELSKIEQSKQFLESIGVINKDTIIEKTEN